MITTDESKTRKAALLLMTLGVDTAVEVSKLLDQSLAYDVIREAAKMQNIEESESEKVLREFLELAPAMKGVPSGKRFAAEVLRRSFGEEQSTSIDFLKRLDRSHLQDIVETEHPQVASFILSFVSPDVASQLLASLPAARQADIARRIATAEPPQREGITHLVRSLSNRLSFLGTENVGEEVNGVDALVSIMKNVGRDVEQNILASFEELEPALAEEIKKQMFVFDDLVLLDDKSLQKVLREVDGKILALALRNASADIIKLIERNLSERAKNILREDIESAGKVRIRDVEVAQTQVVSIVRRLEEAGEIVVSKEEETFV